MINFFDTDKRPHKHGWFKGDYFCRCRCCNGEYIGSKGSYHCADCAYGFDEQLTYEKLWMEVGWIYTVNYVMKNFKSRLKAINNAS
tara:strand:+ start:45 stop:302 length:258 start_codon:yes stop_codon:yes gene_type:complete